MAFARRAVFIDPLREKRSHQDPGPTEQTDHLTVLLDVVGSGLLQQPRHLAVRQAPRALDHALREASPFDVACGGEVQKGRDGEPPGWEACW